VSTDLAAFKAAILRGCSAAFDRPMIQNLTKERFGIAKIVDKYAATFFKIMEQV
jgi:hypothetical protein